MPSGGSCRSSDAFGKWVAKDDTPKKVNKENKMTLIEQGMNINNN